MGGAIAGPTGLPEGAWPSVAVHATRARAPAQAWWTLYFRARLAPTR
jgi:hypothetical protein